MIIQLKVFEQTLSIVYTKSIPRQGSKDYLVLQFLFSSDWKDLDKLCYLQHGEVSQPIDVVDNIVEVPEWFTEQDSFDVTLFGKSGNREVPTNVVSLRLEKSNTLWEQDAPEPQPSWLAKVIDLNSHPPIPGENGYWLIWDTDKGAYVESELPLPDVDAMDKYNGMTPVECVYTHFGSQQTKIIYVEEGTLIPPSSSASDDIKNAWKRLLAIPLSGLAPTGPSSSFKDLIRGIGLLADNGVFGDLLSQSGNEFICYTDIFKQEVCLHIYNSKTDDKTITVYFNFYKQDKYQQVIYCISNDTFNDYCSFEAPVKQYLSNINATALTMPQTEMAAAPTKDMHIATKKYVDDSVSNPLNITSATVGQIAKITVVDDSGKPTAWEAVDMPSGGGGAEREWTMLGEIDISAVGGGNIELTDLGNFTEFYATWKTVINESTTASGYNLLINDVSIANTAIPIQKTGTSSNYGWMIARYNGLVWEFQRSFGAITEGNVALSNSNSNLPYNLHLGVGKATKFKLLSPSLTEYKAVSGVINIYGR